MRKTLLAIALGAALCACASVAVPRKETAVAEIQPASPPTIVALSVGDHPEAYVTQVETLKSGAKLYSLAGGDPMINGVHVFIAAFAGEADGGWRAFKIGDFNSWKLLDDCGAYIVLEVSRSRLDEAGALATAAEKLIVSVPSAADASVTITPANIGQ